MESPSGMDLRRDRRLDVEAPVWVRHCHDASDPIIEGVTKNLGLAGAYFIVQGAHAFAVDELMTVAVSIPEGHATAFPFCRLSGIGRIVRVHEFSGNEEPRRRGVAVEFMSGLTALSSSRADL